jgi:hypothetical protein
VVTVVLQFDASGSDQCRAPIGLIKSIMSYITKLGYKITSEKNTLKKPKEEGRVPRITKLMALAIRFQNLIDTGEVLDQADLARIGNVTRARITQIMSLLYLAPDLQQTLLFLPRTVKRRDPIRERHIRPLAAELEWRKQRQLWKKLKLPR